MKNSHYFANVALGAALIGTGITDAFAAEPTIRELAKERGRCTWLTDFTSPP